MQEVRLLRQLEKVALDSSLEIAVLGMGLEFRGLSIKIGVLHDFLYQVSQ